MFAPISERYLSHAQTALRVVAGAAWGAGPYSIDAMLGRKHTSR